ncbi:MAG: response regulator [Gammaproteobacteria bacterium]|nr:response regulator [Gammaproteobacteria bacterium]
MNHTPFHDQLTEAQAKAIFLIAEDAIVSVDSQHRIILFNEGAEKLFGYRQGEILGRELGILIPQQHRENHPKHLQQFADSVPRARRMGERGEIYGLRIDGTEFPMEASISAIGDGDELVFTAILRDISERKAQTEELRKAKQTAESADYAKSMFLANMSHEIRTPLNAVVGMTSLLLDTQLTDEQQDCTETIRSSSETLLAIINDILDYSKIEVGKLELENQAFDLRSCIEASLDLVSPVASKKLLNLAYMIDDQVPAVIVSDVTRLRQVLVNLLSNATKFTQRGEVLVKVEAGRVPESNRYRFRFSVTDTGIGIAMDEIDELFKPFNQLDVSTTRKFGGTGLGLAISRRLVEAMGGQIWVESEPGQGSTFHFDTVAEAGGKDLAKSFLREDAIELTGAKLLIVDDNVTNRRILVKQSLLWGMQPMATPSGIEAMDLVRHGDSFDIAILDMSMPDMDGLELARQIREYRSPESLPLIMLTSLSQRPDRELMNEIQFSAHLNKPIKASQLLDAFRVALGAGGKAGKKFTPINFDSTLAQSNPLKILIAEDNAINQKVVQRLLQKFGYRSDVVANGLEALNVLERQHYDLILMDLHMPEMDGLEAAGKIQQRFSPTQGPRIVAMTANVLPGDRDACREVGMQDFLAKPINLDHLYRILENANASFEHEIPSNGVDGSVDIDFERLEMVRATPNDGEGNLLTWAIDAFITDAEERLSRMRGAAAKSDWSRLAEEAHRFYSSASNLGLIKISNICIEIELEADNSETNKIELLEQLTEACERVLPELERQKSMREPRS